MSEPSVVDEVTTYLQESRDRYEQGSDEYLARKCLDSALKAYRTNNYGIGAVAVVYEDGRVREFAEGNRMVSEGGVIDHAETRAVLRILGGKDQPDAEYEFRSPNKHGLWVFGTLEPCPMCACVMTNAGVTRSVSTIEDGHLIDDAGFQVSDGAANVLGDKNRTQPAVWRGIQHGRGLQFELLTTTDAQLQMLSRRIFEETRAGIDRDLTDRTHVGHSSAVRESYSMRLQRST